jgi:hypothetical protein
LISQKMHIQRNNGLLSWFSPNAVVWCTCNTRHIKTVINDFIIYLVFLQHFENKRFQTTAQTLRHNTACVVTLLPWSDTSSPLDLLSLIVLNCKKYVSL